MSTLLQADLDEEQLLHSLAPLQSRLARHPLYTAVRSLPELRVFMQSHVFAVWDFMALLKDLQRRLTCVEPSWRPTADAASRRLINEIVLGEESDVYEGAAISHFELYLRAMRQAGADTGPVERFLGELFGLMQGGSEGSAGLGRPFQAALASAQVPQEAAAFVRATFEILATGETHRIAAAFTFGREDLIPEMFAPLVREIDQELPGQVALFRYYLDRHIEMDGDQHGPMALQMVRNLCPTPRHWEEAAETARAALQARLALWDGILARLG